MDKKQFVKVQNIMIADEENVLDLLELSQSYIGEISSNLWDVLFHLKKLEYANDILKEYSNKIECIVNKKDEYDFSNPHKYKFNQKRTIEVTENQIWTNTGWVTYKRQINKEELEQ